MTDVSRAQLQKAIAAAQRERSKHPAAFRPDRRQLAKLKKNRAASEKMLSAFFQQAGLNTQEFEALQQKRDSDLAAMVEHQKADAIQRAARVKDTFYSSARAQQIKAWQDLSAADGFFPYPTFTLDTPFEIYSLNVESWEGARVPFASWAKIKLVSTETDGTERITFLFNWDNPYSSYAVINAVTYISATGHLQAHAYWGLGPQESSVVTYAEFGIWLGLPLPINPTGIDYSQEYFGGVGAESETFSGGDTEGRSVSAGFQLSKLMFAVPPLTSVTFEVALEIDYHNDSGSVEADFASGDFMIECPLVVYQVVYPPVYQPPTSEILTSEGTAAGAGA
jgi:hypothetical protein